ncbi:MAG TPA: cupredoxin family copper-binding protein [Stellaceae bacterium]
MTILRSTLAALALMSVAGAGFAAEPNTATPNTVTIDNFAFDPPLLTVAPGTQVTWVNKDEEPHTVTSVNKDVPFKSAGLDTDDKFSFTFTKAGTYKYFCSVHPHMVGTVVVK